MSEEAQTFRWNNTLTCVPPDRTGFEITPLVLSRRMAELLAQQFSKYYGHDWSAEDLFKEPDYLVIDP